MILNADETRVLLHLRGDIRLWSLPGGGVEPGEAWEEAAVREAYEETGYRIAIDRLVGEYRRPQIGDTKRLFVGRIRGGAPRARPPETIRIAWFSVDRLPPNRLPWLREYVADAVSHHPRPLHRTQLQSWRQILALRLLFALADWRHRLASRRDR